MHIVKRPNQARGHIHQPAKVNAGPAATQVLGCILSAHQWEQEKTKTEPDKGKMAQALRVLPQGAHRQLQRQVGNITNTANLGDRLNQGNPGKR